MYHFSRLEMGCTQSFDVHVEADDIQDGDVVGCFCCGCSDGCMGRIKNAPVPYVLRAPTGKKKEIIKYSDIEKFKEIDDHSLNVSYIFNCSLRLILANA